VPETGINYYYREVLMTSYREILRLYAQGISQRSIARSCDCSRNTVFRVISQAQQQKVEWNQIKDLSDGDLNQKLFPTAMQAGLRKVPDSEYIHREMKKRGYSQSIME
jgi:hypothetical protein